MKGTQLIPTSAKEDSRSISIEPVGSDLATTMQVSLAKRIIQPGTNRVVCLAAETTVPMETDDIASVSDLALRLSDGTNVKVQMSFFNDLACGAGFVGTGFAGTSTRRTYDPDWYESHREPEGSNRLWLVFAAFLAVTLGSFFYFIPGGIEKLAAEIVAAMPPLPAPAAIKTPAFKQVAPVTGSNATPVNASQPNRKTKRTYSNKTAKASSIKSPRKSSKTQYMTAKVSRSSSSGSRSMLIPPPPPTAFAIPISQMAMYNLPPYAMPAMPAAAPAKGGSSVPKAKLLNLDIPKQTSTSAPDSNTNKAQSLPKHTLSPQVQALFPEPARAYSHPRSSSTSYTERSDKPATISSANSLSAPVPGAGSPNSEPPQLERIQLP